MLTIQKYDQQRENKTQVARKLHFVLILLKLLFKKMQNYKVSSDRQSILGLILLHSSINLDAILLKRFHLMCTLV